MYVQPIISIYNGSTARASVDAIVNCFDSCSNDTTTLRPFDGLSYGSRDLSGDFRNASSQAVPKPRVVVKKAAAKVSRRCQVGRSTR